MPIKRYLKSLGITLKDFAERIKLSRPTLDSYIDMYERGEDLPKDRYQIIFDELFANRDKSKEEFNSTLASFEELLDQDARYGVCSLGVDEADIITDLLNVSKKDLSNEDWDRNVYVFINHLISSYREVDSLRYLAKYFNVLNGICPAEDVLEEEKPYLALLFHAFSKIVNGDFDNYEADYIEFLARRDELDKIRKERVLTQHQMLNETIKSVIDKASQAGINLSEEEVLERAINANRNKTI